MNFNPTLADYSNAANRYLAWLVATHSRSDRTLYDFFDSQEILIFIKPKGFKRFRYDIHRKIKLPKRDHWVAFLGGVIVYFTDSEKYFLKWTDGDLQNGYYSKYRKS